MLPNIINTHIRIPPTKLSVQNQTKTLPKSKINSNKTMGHELGRGISGIVSNVVKFIKRAKPEEDCSFGTSEGLGHSEATEWRRERSV